MTDMISVNDPVVGWETIQARPISPEESEYRTARDEAEKAWREYYKLCDAVEDSPEDTILRSDMALAQGNAIAADDAATLLYSAWMHSDGEFQNLRYLASVS